MTDGPLRVLLLGATGTAGRATAGVMAARGHDLLCLVRPGADVSNLPPSARVLPGEITAGAAGIRAALAGERIDAMVSCLASRTGAPADAWAVDHRAHSDALRAAREAGARYVVLLSAICVQKPRLAFQHAKLAFERELMASGLRWSIARPTALFKSLSGQVARVLAGRPFLAFGDGRLTACKPIHDDDLGAYLADCLSDPTRWDRVLPIGGPGPAITPRDQAAMLSDLLGRPVRVRSVPPALLSGAAAVLGAAGRVAPRLAANAELARIGHYYATESMLVLDPATGRYDADATPETGARTLRDHYAALLRGDAEAGLGAHAAF